MGRTVYNSSGQILQGSSTLADESVDSDHYVDASIDNIHLAAGIDAVKLADGSVTNTELQYINTLGSNAQVQISAKAAVGSGTPSTQTLPDTAATGTSTEAARLDHVHAMPAGGGGAVTYEGGNTTEATSTSTSLADLLTADGGLGIGATVPITTRNLYRKTAGAAARAGFIIRKINAIELSTDVGIDANNNVPATAGGGTITDRAEAGYAFTDIRPIITNYTFGSVQGHYASAVSGGGHQNMTHTRPAGTTADKPNATVDTIVIGVQMGAGITAGADEFHVYSHAIS